MQQGILYGRNEQFETCNVKFVGLEWQTNQLLLEATGFRKMFPYLQCEKFGVIFALKLLISKFFELPEIGRL